MEKKFPLIILSTCISVIDSYWRFLITGLCMQMQVICSVLGFFAGGQYLLKSYA